MIIPDKITIGVKEYRVKRLRFIELFNSNIQGQICYGEGVLKIKNVGDERATEEVFFHELAHGILHEMEFNYPQITKFRNDEQFTQELGLVLRKTFLELIEGQKP